MNLKRKNLYVYGWQKVLHVKNCFVNCAVFPKDYEFEEKEVYFLWMTKNLIQQREDNGN